jgi:hypothetical protein
MATTTQTIAFRFGTLCRNCAVAVIAGFWRSRSIKDINQQIKGRSTFDQVWITLGVLGLLLGLSMVAAQAGWIGLMAYWLAVILLVN